jgi:two-component system sensor histidine kinase MtrB
MPTFTLRKKTVLLGVAIASLLSLLASVSTFLLAREYMLRQRDDVAVAQVRAAARIASSTLLRSDDPLTVLLAGAQVLPGARAALHQGGTWLVSGVGLAPEDLPVDLVRNLETGSAARQRAKVQFETAIIVGFPLQTQGDTWFVGVVSLEELERTLLTLRGALAIGAILAIVGGGAVGWWLSRRVMEPLHDISSTAEQISGGDLTKRAKEPREPDLARIAQTFNEMTDSLRVRIDREARFGAVVSHELRSPLTVIKGAADLIAARREDLPPRAQLGSDLLSERVIMFEKILNDLIEINRYQSGTVEPLLEELSARSLVETLSHRSGIDPRIIEVPEIAVVVDVRRFQQVFENLNSNAKLYAGGLVAIRSKVTSSHIELYFDDAGVGVSVADSSRIFEPFVRGVQHSAVSGSGLGLSITVEHLRVMGGNVQLGTSPEGGARFVVVLRRGEDFS